MSNESLKASDYPTVLPSDADISSKAKIFRERIIQEFRLDETILFDDSTDPKYSTAELFPQFSKKKL